jgi:leucyl/phenylalanyl-tRNA--protein transferase
VIPLAGFHVSRRLARTVRAEPFEVRVDTAFHQVVLECAAAGPGRTETWINRPIERLYLQLHQLGQAHSVECWQDGQLVGGLYGVSLRGAFFGESMFSRRTDASKVALVHLVARLIAGGFVLLDAQFMTEHLRQFGAEEIARADYHRRLAAALEVEADFYGVTGAALGAGSAALGAGSAAFGAGARAGAAAGGSSSTLGSGGLAGGGRAGAGAIGGALALQLITQAS